MGNLPDVNVLVYAHNRAAPRHQRFRDWLEEQVNASADFGLAELVLSSFIRVVTHPRVMAVPTPLVTAFDFVAGLRGQPNVVVVAPGAQHWEIFRSLATSVDARGNLVADAYLAALAIESGCEFVTTDRDFARFPGLRWRHPLRP
ncbi:MAG TPA: type II toxin-antitoxin system VapC family toxin [Mycobacteriales bacterium]|nr:type II toxin-antitoxin system VapC family toxin [Mycobacteriales bacterium]